MTQPPMRQENGLGALQMGITRHDGFACRFGLLDQCGLQIFQYSVKSRNGLQHPQSQIRCNLIVTASSRVKFACRVTNQLCETAFDRGVNVFVGRSEGKPSRRKFFLDSRKPKGDGAMLFIRKNSCAVNRIRPGATRIYILNRHAFINRQGCVEVESKLVEFLSEAPTPEGHRFSFSNATFMSPLCSDLKVALRNLISF